MKIQSRWMKNEPKRRPAVNVKKEETEKRQKKQRRIPNATLHPHFPKITGMDMVGFFLKMIKSQLQLKYSETFQTCIWLNKLTGKENRWKPCRLPFSTKWMRKQKTVKQWKKIISTDWQRGGQAKETRAKRGKRTNIWVGKEAEILWIDGRKKFLIVLKFKNSQQTRRQHGRKWPFRMSIE